MPLLKDGRPADDPFVSFSDEEKLPDGASAIVSLDRWRAERDLLISRNGPVGVRLRSDQRAQEIAGDLDRISVIAIEFPVFSDGRGYSTARLLRERYGYRGELRAVGDVLRDQFLFLLRCGFDALEVADDATAEAWNEAVGEFTVWYQPTADGLMSALALRHRLAAAE